MLPDEELAADLRGFGPAGIVAMIVILITSNVTIGPLMLPVGAFLVLAWATRSRTPWHEIGYVRPRSWIGSLVVGLVFGAVFKLVMKALVMPLLGADPINQPYHYLAGNRAVLPAAIFTMLAAGFGEETVFRGYLFERLGKVFGSSAGARVGIVALSTALFALGHYPNLGWTGVEQATFTGLAFGGIFALTGRLWMLMWAHAAFDLAALAIIYWHLEARVAHLVFN